MIEKRTTALGSARLSLRTLFERVNHAVHLPRRRGPGRNIQDVAEAPVTAVSNHITYVFAYINFSGQESTKQMRIARKSDAYLAGCGEAIQTALKKLDTRF